MKLIVKLASLIVVFSSLAHAQCADVFKDVPIANNLATSASFANLRGTEDSLKAMSKKMMLQAVGDAAKATPPEPFCPTGCKTKAEPQIIFASTPNKYLSDYGDKKVCQELKEKSLKSPINFKNKLFNNLEDLNSYYGDLCRGSGTDGKELYKICHSSCSPSYSSTIFKNGSGYQMDTDIICNDARDKDEGMYKLTSFYRWTCEAS